MWFSRKQIQITVDDHPIRLIHSSNHAHREWLADTKPNTNVTLQQIKFKAF